MKWKPLRIAAILYVLTALSATVVSGTFAKYTTEAASSDTARVAKWGVTAFVEGNLFGTYYEAAPSNTIIENDDGSITVRSVHTATVGDDTVLTNVVAPGTENKTGLTFGLSGKPETALKVEITVQDQNIALKPGVFCFLHKAEANTSDIFDSLKLKYGKLYKASGGAFIPADAFDSGVSIYYYADNEVDLTGKGDWPYCPVVFELNPTAAGSGLGVNRTGITGSSAYTINAFDKSLDIIGYYIKIFGLNDGSSWPLPTVANHNVMERKYSKVFPAGTDLSEIRAFASNPSLNVGLNSERLTWAWDYRQATNPDLYDKADNILGRLAYEKLNGTLDDGFVVKQSGESLVRPTEYEDYCLETMFSIEMTITQID